MIRRCMADSCSPTAAGGRYEATAELLDYTQPNAKWTQSKINILFSAYL